MRADHRNRPAIADGVRPPLDRVHLDATIERVVAQLRAAGVSVTDVVGVVLPDGPELAVAFLAISAGAGCAPLNPAYGETELEFFLSDLDATTVVVGESGHPAAERAAAKLGLSVLRAVPGERAGQISLFTGEVELPVSGTAELGLRPDAVALLLHTSGTTGRPKLVPIRHRALQASAATIARTLALGPDDVSLVVMPLFHIHGLVASLLAPLSVGGQVVVPSGVTSSRLGTLIEASGATWYSAVPTLHQAVLEIARTRRLAHTLRFARSSSASLSPTVAAELEAVLGVPVIEAYGMTEAAHQMASNPLPPHPRKPGSVGTPSIDIAITDEQGRQLPAGAIGEVVIRGESVIDGYAANPEADAASFREGWFRTGDQGYFDADGYLFLTGRIKELINRAGEKIAPREIEDLLAEHPDVASVAVFAVPDERLGEQVAAAVVRRGEVSERELRLFAAARLVPFKVPRRIVFCDALPKGPTGKLARRGLAEQLGLRDLDAVEAPRLPFRAPDGPVEELVADFWSIVLGRPVPDANARFMDCGGDSLAAARLVTMLADELDVEFGLLDLFDAPTVAAQAEVLAFQVVDR